MNKEPRKAAKNAQYTRFVTKVSSTKVCPLIGSDDKHTRIFRIGRRSALIHAMNYFVFVADEEGYRDRAQKRIPQRCGSHKIKVNVLATGSLFTNASTRLKIFPGKRYQFKA